MLVRLLRNGSGNHHLLGLFFLHKLAAIIKGNKPFCGGSLIDSNHILTAAHCVGSITPDGVSRLTVRLGDHDLARRGETPQEPIDYRVLKVIRHRKFSFDLLIYDIALLVLAERVRFSSAVRPVCLAPPVNMTYADDEPTIAGWGTLKEEGSAVPSSVLRDVQVPVVSNAQCAVAYGANAPAGILPNQLCAGSPDRDSCRGDSGGPLVRKAGIAWEQIGVVSWGIGCGLANFPGVYTRISAFRDWLDQNIAQDP